MSANHVERIGTTDRMHRMANLLTIWRRSVVAVAVSALVLVACGDSDSASTATVDDEPATSIEAPATTPAPTVTTVATTTVAPSTTLPGEPFDTYVPRDGELVVVVGVAHDDALNVRAGPGVEYGVVTTLGPLADDVVGTGDGRLRADSIWWRVVADGVGGWVNSAFIARRGGVDDLTSLVVDRLGAIPVAETMAELGALVAGTFASDEPPSTITMTSVPTVGDVGEVTYDVIGLGDDAQRGYRLHVFGQPDGGGGSFSLMSVEATALCDRGVTPEGLCV